MIDRKDLTKPSKNKKKKEKVDCDKGQESTMSDRKPRKRKQEQLECEMGENERQSDRKIRKLSSIMQFFKPKPNDKTNPPCYSNSGDQQVRGEILADIEGGQRILGNDRSEQRAMVGCGNNLPVNSAAAAGVRNVDPGGKLRSTHVQY